MRSKKREGWGQAGTRGGCSRVARGRHEGGRGGGGKDGDEDEGVGRGPEPARYV